MAKLRAGSPRLLDVLINIATVLGCIAMLFVSNEVGLAIGGGLFFMVGLWSLLFPDGPLKWASTAYPAIDPIDDRLWWISRLIGACIMIISLILITALV